MESTNGNFLQKLMKRRINMRTPNALDKLGKDTRVIRERKKYETIEPFPDGTFHQLASNQILEMIVNYLPDISDINSAYFTCPTFQNLLGERRQILLMQKVSKIMRKEGYIFSDIIFKINCLDVRGVCNSCKNIWDKGIFESSFSDDSWYLTAMLEMNLNRFAVDEFYISFFYKVESVDATDPYHPIRKLQVNGALLTGHKLRLFHSKINAFLDSHGSSIWYLQYEGGNQFSAANSYENLWRIVSKTPNLKALNLKCVTVKEPFQTLNGDEQLNIEETFEIFPFPRLESLEHFHFYSEHDYVLTQIYENCLNLSSVNCKFSQSCSHRQLRALQELKLEYYWTASNNFSCSIINSKCITWPLEALRLEHYCKYGFEKASVLWPILNKFGTTLEKLHIHFAVLKEENTQTHLYLPNLKYLELNGEATVDGTVEFDNLIHLTALEEVSIRYVREKDYESGDDTKLVQVNGYIRKMECSNIWNLFPSLNRLKFILQGTKKTTKYFYYRKGETLTAFETVHTEKGQSKPRERECQIGCRSTTVRNSTKCVVI